MNTTSFSRKLLRTVVLTGGCLVLVALLFVAVLFFEGEDPAVTLDGAVDSIGRNGSFSFAISDSKSGLRSISIVAVQGAKTHEIYAASFPRAALTGHVGPAEVKETLTFDTRKLGLEEGPMVLRLTVSDYSLRGWLRGNTTVVEKSMNVDTVPPRLNLLHSEKYISPGGAGIAVYRLSEEGCRSGVTINGRFHPGFPVGNGRNDVHIAYFALPHDAAKVEQATVSAADRAGNEALQSFMPVYKGVAKKTDTIAISEAFLAAKVPEFQQHYPEMKGDLLQQYLFTNTTLRDRNNRQIEQLCATPLAERLWQGAFGRMAGSPRAGFADHRSYAYNGAIIDQQVHLGVDIASTSHAEVRAANRGKVIFAEYLGIYGNMVLIDHGQGVFSLYSHLSQIATSPGTLVDKGTPLGLTGTSGMAGGDHLHFSMLVNGVFVMPKEWWDPHWIEVTIDGPLAQSKM
jgi:murein DD-endopeptidase MepM/ murein hydrolase activator NlpD